MPVHVLISDTEAGKFLDHLFENIVKLQLADGVITAVCDVVSAAHTDDTLNTPVYNELWKGTRNVFVTQNQE